MVLLPCGIPLLACQGGRDNEQQHPRGAFLLEANWVASNQRAGLFCHCFALTAAEGIFPVKEVMRYSQRQPYHPLSGPLARRSCISRAMWKPDSRLGSVRSNRSTIAWSRCRSGMPRRKQCGSQTAAWGVCGQTVQRLPGLGADLGCHAGRRRNAAHNTHNRVQGPQVRNFCHFHGPRL